MANYKKITAVYSTGATVYCIVKRDVDGYFLTALKTSFTDTISYPAMTEDADIKGLYVLDTDDVAWDDGTYTIAAYVKTGSVAAPESDIMIGYGTMRIAADQEVLRLTVTLTRPVGAVVSDENNTSSTFKTDLAVADNTYVRAWIKFTSGSLAGQVSKIEAYNGTTKFITVTEAFTGTPSDGDDFVIVNE